MNDRIIMYGTPTCPMVPPVRGVLERAKAEFEYVNISRDEAARTKVRDINSGYESVPTLVFPDGSTLTEPSLSQLEAKLSSLGYEITPPTLWQSLAENPFYSLLGIAAFIFGLIDGNFVFVLIGIGLLAYVLLKDRLT